MDITFTDVNPYRETLIEKAEKAQTFEEFEEVCSVTEYVDRVQMAAIVAGNLPDVPEDVTEDEILEMKSSEEQEEDDPQKILREMYEDFKKGEGEDE